MGPNEKLEKIEKILDEYDSEKALLSMDPHECSADRERGEKTLMQKALEDITKVLSEK